MSMETEEEKVQRVSAEIEEILQREKMLLTTKIQLHSLPQEPTPSPITIKSDR